jgi:hypothetical protein
LASLRFEYDHDSLRHRGVDLAYSAF